MAKRVRSGGRPAAKRAPARRPSNGLPRPTSTADASSSAPLAEPEILEPSDGLDELPRASSGHLTDSEIRRAEEIQAQMAAQERAAMAEQIRRRQRARAGIHEIEDVNAPLRVRASKEYAYVARDVRRIILTGGLMVAILAVLAVAINVMGLITF